MVLHDNSPNLKAAIQAAYTAGGGSAYISNGMGYVPFNSTMDLTNGLTNVFSYSVKIHSNNNFVIINQPWILRSSIDIEGEPHQTTSFSYVNGSQFLGIPALEGTPACRHLVQDRAQSEDVAARVRISAFELLRGGVR